MGHRSGKQNVHHVPVVIKTVKTCSGRRWRQNSKTEETGERGSYQFVGMSEVEDPGPTDPWFQVAGRTATCSTTADCCWGSPGADETADWCSGPAGLFGPYTAPMRLETVSPPSLRILDYDTERMRRREARGRARFQYCCPAGYDGSSAAGRSATDSAKLQESLAAIHGGGSDLRRLAVPFGTVQLRRWESSLGRRGWCSKIIGDMRRWRGPANGRLTCPWHGSRDQCKEEMSYRQILMRGGSCVVSQTGLTKASASPGHASEVIHGQRRNVRQTRCSSTAGSRAKERQGGRLRLSREGTLRQTGLSQDAGPTATR